MIKKINFRMLLVLASVFAFTTSAFADWAGGTGTKSDPFLVQNADQLATIRTDAAQWTWVALVGDIDFADAGVQAPFDNVTGKLQLSIEGNGFVIKNLQLTGKGFCSQLDGTIQNLGFDNVTVTSTATFGSAVIAGHSWSGKVFNCYVINSTVTAPTTDADGQAVGTIIGAAMGAGQVINCYSDNVTVTGRIGVGGLIGRDNFTVKTSAAFGGVISCKDSVADQGDGKGIGYVGPISGDTWNEAKYVAENLFYASEKFTYKLDGTETPNFLSKTNDGTTDIATAVVDADLLTEASYPGFDFDNEWVMGTAHPELQVNSNAKINISLPDTVAADTATYKVPFMVFRAEAGDVFCYSIDEGDDVEFTAPTSILGNVFVVGLANGTNHVMIKVKRGDAVVGKSSLVINATVVAGLNKLNAVEVTAYPNPSTGLFNVTSINPSDITVRDFTGKTLFSQSASAGVNSIDLSAYGTGAYLLTVQNAQEAGTVILQVK